MLKIPTAIQYLKQTLFESIILLELMTIKHTKLKKAATQETAESNQNNINRFPYHTTFFFFKMCPNTHTHTHTLAWKELENNNYYYYYY